MSVFQDYKEIETLLGDYFAAVSAADIGTLKTIFHENASMYGYLGNDAVIGTPEIFFSDLAGKPSMKSQGVDCRMVIKNISVCGRTAQASIFVDNFFGALDRKSVV